MEPDNQTEVNIVLSRYPATQKQLIEIAEACQNRTFAEEVEIVERLGGEEFLFKGLKVDPTVGLRDSELAERKSVFGSNEKPIIELTGYCQLLWNALQDFTLRILIVAAIISIALEVGVSEPKKRKTAWIEGVAILIAVAVCANVTAFNDYQKGKQFQKLNTVADSRKEVTVRRNGKFANLHQDLLLVGDIVNLSEGMEIPADGFVIEASEVQCDQSAMTGEADPIHKNIYAGCKSKRDEVVEKGQRNSVTNHEVPSCVVLSGTRILSGEGKMIVIVVGDFSCLGKIRLILMQKEPDATPLQMKLEMLASDIGKFGLISAVLVFLILMARLAAECIIEGKWDNSTRWVEVVQHFILAITVVVVAIPQGLPLAVTLSLAYSVTKMLDDNNLVRKMEACETMGGANNICSDKTGTLTLNRMTLTTIWNGKIDDFNLNAEAISLKEQGFSQPFEEMFVASLCCNSSAMLRPVEKGSSTEIAFLKFMAKAGYDYEKIRESYQVIAKFPFNSSRKRMSVVISYKGHIVLFCKGASELVLKCCTRWHNKTSDAIETITPETEKVLEKSITTMAERALRTLVVAYKILTPTAKMENKDNLGVFDIQKDQLVLISVLGVRDIPRPEVPKAVKDCKSANIKVRMVTGDNIITARAIAKEIGIIEPGDSRSIVMEGPEFVKAIGGLVCSKCLTIECDCPSDPARAKREDRPQRIDTVANKEQFNRIVQHLDVLARSRPQDKYALVTGLNERGDIVAVTGDGTNDAPALKKADVGFAMGIAGTEVAREASSIILLDDNFSSIVRAVMWGRNIYDSIRKFIQFQLTVNVVAVVVTIIGSAVLKQQLLSAIQMLWINLIMDTFASLALATEPPTEQQLKRKPHSRTDYIINRRMMKHILGQALFQIIIVLLFSFAGPYFIPETSEPTRQATMLAQLQTTFPGEYSNSFSPRHLGGNASSSLVIFGNYKTIAGQKFYSKILEATGVYSRHFTNVFNVFVFMQIFNFINARKLEDEFNVFEGVMRNRLFIVIVGIIIAVQILLITFTSVFFNLYSEWGLNIIQWLICIAFGSIGLVVSVLLKLLPFGKEAVELKDEEQPQTSGMLIRRNRKETATLHSKPRQIHRIQASG